jgi:hypothetical protein
MQSTQPTLPKPDYKVSPVEFFLVFFFVATILLLSLLTIFPAAATSLRGLLGVHS